MISFVQLASGSAATTQHPAVTFGSSVTAGDFLLIPISWTSATGSVTSVTDSLGNTYVALGPIALGSIVNISIQFWGCVSQFSGSCTVTGNLSASETSALAEAYEWSGLSSTVDAYATHNYTSATANPLVAVTATQYDLLFGYCRGGSLSAIGPGWTEGHSLNSQYVIVAPGHYPATWILSSSNTTVCALVALEGSGSPPSPPTPPAQGEIVLSGTQLSGGTTASGSVANLFDADYSTGWKTSTTGAWAGIDASVPVVLTRVRITPPGGDEQYCTGLAIQGASDSAFATAVTLYSILNIPQTPGWLSANEYLMPSGGSAYRYFRVLAPGIMSLSDVEFVATTTSGATGVCVSPVMTLNGGVYDVGVRVRLSSATLGASIYYTTDGSTPTTSSTLYSGPFVVSSDGTIIRSLAAISGYSNSRVTFTPSTEANSDNVSPGIFHIKNDIIPGKQRYDSNRGYRMSISEGCVFHDPVSGWWYRYGASFQPATSTIYCSGSDIYKSADLRNWAYVGNICAPGSPGILAFQEEYTPIFHRIQILYNAANNNYVAWTADYLPSGTRYHRVWTSPSPIGPFTLINTFTSGIAGLPGAASGPGLDFSTFIDPVSGNAYIIWVYAADSGDQDGMAFYQLNSSYTDVLGTTGTYYTIDWGSSPTSLWRESPAMFYRNGTYFLMVSGQTGADYNTNYYITASSPLGPWNGTQTNPFQVSTHEDYTIAYRSQCMQGVKIPGRDDGTGFGAYYYFGFRNYSDQVANSGNCEDILLPIVFPTSTSMTISWDTYVNGWSFDSIFPTVSGAPAAATGLSMSGAILLSWANNELNPYVLYLDRATNSGFTANVVSEVLPMGTTSFNDPLVVPGTVYFYRVRTVNASGTTNSATVSGSPAVTLGGSPWFFWLLG